MKKQKNKVMTCVVLIGLMILIGSISVYALSIFYPKVFLTIMYIGVSFFCTYKWFEVLVTKEKLRKLECIEWWLYTACMRLLYENYVDTINEEETLIILCGMIMFAVRVLVIYFRTDDWELELGICFISFITLFFLAICTVQMEELFFVFKVLSIFSIFSAVKIVGHTNRFWGMLIIIYSYILIIVLYGVLNSEFLLLPLEEACRNFYVAIQSLYELPKLENLNSNKEIMKQIVNFLMCRIMDAILIGTLVNILNENHLGWFENRKKISNATTGELGQEKIENV